MTENQTIVNASQKMKDELKIEIKDISSLLEIVEQKRVAINEAISAVAENYQIDKKLIRKLVKTYHKNEYKKEVDTMREFELLYEGIFGG